MIHRVNQAIRQRVVHPDKPLEPATGVLTRYSVPPEKLVAKAADQIKGLVRIADVKKGMSSPNITTGRNNVYRIFSIPAAC